MRTYRGRARPRLTSGEEARYTAPTLWTALALLPLTALPWGALVPSAEGWAESRLGAIRGVTLGPIENARHPGRGYGTQASARALDEAVRMGATWVSLTPFGRAWDLDPDGIDLTFEAPFEKNRADVLTTIRQAHDRGLRVMLVPHLWIESQEWRALIDFPDDAGWARWAASYRRFLTTWAQVAEEGGVEMLSVGVELRSWVTTPRAESFIPIIHEVRSIYSGLLTYSANWDDVEHTLIFGELDLIGINAFYPLAEASGASPEALMAGGERVATRIEWLAKDWDMPVVLTEIGYTNRTDPALRPWEWPESMKDVTLDEDAQADAYRAIIAPCVSRAWCAGLFVWRLYADPDDVSQEPEYGFSPRGKRAEIVMRDAFSAQWAADGPALPGGVIGRHRARYVGLYGPDLFDPLPLAPGDLAGAPD